VEHDRDSLAGSEWVWLSSAGRDLANALGSADRLTDGGATMQGVVDLGITPSNTRMEPTRR
jgi:hypothetical protein